MDATKFYTEEKFGLFIGDGKMHGSGLRLDNSKGGVNLKIKRKGSGSGSVNGHIFLLTDNEFKTQFLVNQLCGPLHSKFDYIVLICPTFAHNKTLYRFGENDPRMYVIVCAQHDVEIWLNILSRFFEGTNTLIVLDDYAASKDVKGPAISASACGC